MYFFFFDRMISKSFLKIMWTWIICIWGYLVSPIKGGRKSSQTILLFAGILRTLPPGNPPTPAPPQDEMECLPTRFG